MKQYNSVDIQKRQWPNAAGSDLQVGSPLDGNLYSYGWGDPDSIEAKNVPGQILGNYKKIKDEYLIPNIKNKTVLDIGSFDGKWTNYMGEAKLIICADLDKKGFDVIEKRLGWESLEFFLCEGDNLTGIKDGTIDFVFSMDSLVRSERDLINSYISEIKRVLAPGGKVCMHLPAQDQHLSWELGFTQIGSQDIINMCHEYGLGPCSVDKITINHGVLLLVGF